MRSRVGAAPGRPCRPRLPRWRGAARPTVSVHPPSRIAVADRPRGSASRPRVDRAVAPRPASPSLQPRRRAAGALWPRAGPRVRIRQPTPAALPIGIRAAARTCSPTPAARPVPIRPQAGTRPQIGTRRPGRRSGRRSHSTWALRCGAASRSISRHSTGMPVSAASERSKADRRSGVRAAASDPRPDPAARHRPSREWYGPGASIGHLGGGRQRTWGWCSRRTLAR